MHFIQNNGRIAHQVSFFARTSRLTVNHALQRFQEVDHVHFHVIPKPSASDEEGLVVGWPAKTIPKDEMEKLYEEIKGKL